MKIKMADVAKALGVSKATVSLAVNQKPGVSEKTRKRILDYIDEKQKEAMRVPAPYADAEIPGSGRISSDNIREENISEKSGTVVETGRQGTNSEETAAGTGGQKGIPGMGGIIKVLIINHQKQVVCDPELDLWSGVLATFDSECRKNGYMYSPSFLNAEIDSKGMQEKVIEECNSGTVSGIILFGTEMEESDIKILRLLKKPTVVYDYDVPGNLCTCVMIDNELAAYLAVDALAKSGAKRIQYLANSKSIYNFKMRRRGFLYALMKHELESDKSNIISLGETIDEITKKAVQYLSNHALPDAFVFENYQVSIGVMNAVRHLKIRVPNQLKYIGIDEVPGYFGGGITLEQIRIPHEERAAMAFRLLQNEIMDGWSLKMKVFASPVLVEGMSV